jgi:hypothetical protein
VHRDADHGVTAAPDGGPEPLALAADDDRQGSAQVRLAGSQRRVGVRADDPETADVEVGQGRREVVHWRQQQVLDGSRRGLDGGRRERRLAMGRVDDALGPGCLGGAQEGAEVLGILERIEDQHEGRLAALDRPGEDVVQAGELAAVGHESDTLMTVETGQGGQGPALDLNDRNPKVRGVEDELLQSLPPLGHHEQPDRLATRQEGLLDGMPAGHDLLVLADQVRQNRARLGLEPGGIRLGTRKRLALPGIARAAPEWPRSRPAGTERPRAVHAGTERPRAVHAGTGSPGPRGGPGDPMAAGFAASAPLDIRLGVRPGPLSERGAGPTIGGEPGPRRVAVALVSGAWRRSEAGAAGGVVPASLLAGSVRAPALTPFRSPFGRPAPWPGATIAGLGKTSRPSAACAGPGAEGPRAAGATGVRPPGAVPSGAVLAALALTRAAVATMAPAALLLPGLRVALRTDVFEPETAARAGSSGLRPEASRPERSTPCSRVRPGTVGPRSAGPLSARPRAAAAS